MVETDENRLKRLRMRSWRRGTREMDLILGPFADDSLAGQSPALRDIFETLLTENDQDLYLWISDRAEVPEKYEEILDQLREFHEL